MEVRRRVTSTRIICNSIIARPSLAGSSIHGFTFLRHRSQARRPASVRHAGVQGGSQVRSTTTSTDTVNLQKALADAVLDSAAAAGDEEVVDRPPPMRHGHQDLDGPVPPAHVVDQPQVHDVRVRRVELLVPHRAEGVPDRSFTDAASPTSPGRARAPAAAGLSSAGGSAVVISTGWSRRCRRSSIGRPALLSG